jgi:predicted permease
MPDWKPEIARRLAPLKLDPVREAEITEELAQHLEDRFQELVSRGATEDQAQRTALAELSDEDLLTKGLRQVEQEAPRKPIVLGSGGHNFLSSLWQDVRYSFRQLRRNPGFAAVAILTLALGIGANTAIFSVVDAVLLRPLPVQHSQQLVDVYNEIPQKILFIRDVPLSYPEYEDLVRQSTCFSGLAAYYADTFALERQSGSWLVPGMLVTGNYFDTLGVGAVLGRTFDSAGVAKPGGYAVAVISHSLWERQFGGNRNVLGKTIELNGNLFTVIGVAPASFNGLAPVAAPQIWVPLTQESWHVMVRWSLENRGANSVQVVGRLRPGRTIQQAQTEMSTIASRLAAQYPKTDKGHTIQLFPANQVRILPGEVDKTLYRASAVLMAVVGLVLLIACTNVAAMSLARAASRRKEIAVRAALGAGRWRLTRQLLTESLLLALGGGAAAVVMTRVANGEFVRALNALPLPAELNVTLGLHVDYRVLIFTMLAVALATMLFGLAPALQASRTTAADVLKEEGRGGSGRRHRLLSALVVAQVAASLVLLVCAGLSLRSVFNAYRINPGFQPRGVVTAQFAPNVVGYNASQAATFYDTLGRRVKRLPGVTSAAFSDNLLPLTLRGLRRPTNVTPSAMAASLPEKQWPLVDRSQVGPGYFRTMGIPILRGREFLKTDTAKAPRVAVVNQALARNFWPGQDPIGKRLDIGDIKKEWEVVGVVATAKYVTLGEKPRPLVYLSILQTGNSSRSIVVRTSGATTPLAASIRRISRQIDPKVPVLDVETLSQAMAPALLLPKLGVDFFGLAGLLGLVLACVGIYGVIAYSVSQRTHEIGIRIALGAQKRDVARMILSRSLLLTLAGVGIGLGLALAVTRVLADILYGISATDPVTFIGVPVLLVLVALLASYVPARRATRVDPVVALRNE